MVADLKWVWVSIPMILIEGIVVKSVWYVPYSCVDILSKLFRPKSTGFAEMWIWRENSIRILFENDTTDSPFFIFIYETMCAAMATWISMEWKFHINLFNPLNLIKCIL